MLTICRKPAVVSVETSEDQLKDLEDIDDFPEAGLPYSTVV